ncbi:MAG: response regulator [Candidatus Taylorbacteria bacterium]|nr:response regulator [Candidatus Taylorbacteria bacterium]
MDTKIPKRVLVIEDDDNLRNILLDALKASGFEVEGAVNGEDGLRMAFEMHPDAIMLDVMMPKMNGWQVLERLRLDEWGRTAKVMILTSLGDVDNIAHAVDDRVSIYVVKSELNMNNLAETINTLIKVPVLKM